MNHILYRMCEERPAHDDVAIISGKTQLIGRAYSAAPSRGVQIADFYDGLARAIAKQGAELDAAIDAVREAGRISMESLAITVKAHGLLNTIVMGFIGSARSSGSMRNVGHRISFCSKYLHFHAPHGFPIYDSVANNALAARQNTAPYAVPKRGSGPTGTYACFCRRFLGYANDAHQAALWTPRSVDGELWPYAVIDTLR